MRLGSCILFYNNYCYLSYGWNFQRPLGRLHDIISSLDEYEVDEILIIRPVRGTNDPYWDKDIKEISNLNISTPLLFGGGIRSKRRLKDLHSLPIERVLFSSCSFGTKKDISLIEEATKVFGRQAIVGCLPYKFENDNLFFFHSRKNTFLTLTEKELELFDSLFNEVILFDCESEGFINQNPLKILERVPFKQDKLIFSGGIERESIKKMKAKCSLAAVYIENSTLFEEQKIKNIKRYAKLN